MRLVKITILLAIAAFGSVSCSLYFREHFFLPGEAIPMDELVGTWDLQEQKDESGHADDEQTKLIFSSPVGETIDCLMQRIQRKGRNVDNLPFVGKAYGLAGKKFLLAWENDAQSVDGKKVRKLSEECNIFHYLVKGDTLVLYGLNKEKFEKLVSGGKLEGHARGGGGYDRRTFHITSPGPKVRSAVLEAGIDGLIELDKPTEFRRTGK